MLGLVDIEERPSSSQWAKLESFRLTDFFNGGGPYAVPKPPRLTNAR